MERKKITVLDTTLRDGAQGEGISFSVDDKIKIVHSLDDLKIDYIEAGNPFSNPKDKEFFQKIKKIKLNHSKIVVFGSTRRCNTSVNEDLGVKALIDAETEIVSIFGKSWDMQVDKILNTTLEENLNMIFDTVKYFKNSGKEVIFDAEHFFDGYLNNNEYALKTIKTAEEAGADTICLCDTNGGSYFEDIGKIVKDVVNLSKVKIGIHCHNDMGIATASTLAAVSSGAVHIQGTLLGFGERCGNANLSAIIPNLQLKLGYNLIDKDSLKKLYSTARTVAETSNITLWYGKPYIGSGAFSHKGGMHIDAVEKFSNSFEHIDPSLVGNERRYLFSEISGKTSILNAVHKIDKNIDKNSLTIKKIIEKLKDMEHKGYQFEAADGSLDILIRKELNIYKPLFELKKFSIFVDYPANPGELTAKASVEIVINNILKTAVSLGAGPVHALDNAFREALKIFYPRISNVHLIDYKVRVMNPEFATAAAVRVLIESTDGEKSWCTVGTSTDVLQASTLALCESFDYYLQNIIS